MNLGLPFRDEKAITAKAVVFRTLPLFEARLFANANGGEDHVKRNHFLAFVSSITTLKQVADDGVPMNAFLSTLIDKLADDLRDRCNGNSEEQVCEQYAAALRVEAKRYSSIIADATNWLHTFKNRAEMQLGHFGISLPQITLGFDSKPEPNAPVGIAARTTSITTGRHIEVILGPVVFSYEHYYSLPCVLSHEFWCHALSCVGPAIRPSWTGCAYDDPWEEGWMDVVQSVILDDELCKMRGVSSAVIACFSRHCDQYLAERHNPSNSMGLSDGCGAADGTFRLARMYLGTENPDQLFVQLSLQVNALTAPALKQKFAKRVWALLNTDDFERLFANRDRLAQNLRETCKYKKRIRMYEIDTERLLLATCSDGD